jgi:hypothetical protein
MGVRLLASMHHAQWNAIHDALESISLSIDTPGIDTNTTVQPVITIAAVAAGT